jgi:hypothetical protein
MILSSMARHSMAHRTGQQGDCSRTVVGIFQAAAGTHRVEVGPAERVLRIEAVT